MKMRKGRTILDSGGLRRGSWTMEEDNKLVSYIMKFGHGNWRVLPKQAGLQRCGKSCRLRWVNYLRPDIKRGNFTKEEEDTIMELHRSLGNKWSQIASQLPGRTDNEIKNIWNTYLKKRITSSSTYSSSSSCSSFSDHSNKTMSVSCEVSSLVTSDTIQTTTGGSFKEDQRFGFQVSDQDDMWIEELEKELDLWGLTSELLDDDSLFHS